MADKYEDLHDRIADEIHWDATVIDVLRWLDDHRDQAPGRTITVSKFDEAVESCVTEDATVPPHTFAERLGVVCVPDTKTTNVERLVEMIRENGYDIRHNGNRSGSVALALDLDSRGVRAPEGGR